MRITNPTADYLTIYNPALFALPPGGSVDVPDNIARALIAKGARPAIAAAPARGRYSTDED